MALLTVLIGTASAACGGGSGSTEVRIEQTSFGELSVFNRKGLFVSIEYGEQDSVAAFLDFRATNLEHWGGSSTTGAGVGLVTGRITMKGAPPEYREFVTNLKVEFRVPDSLNFGPHEIAVPKNCLAHFLLRSNGVIDFAGIHPIAGKWEAYVDGEPNEKSIEEKLLRTLSKNVE